MSASKTDSTSSFKCDFCCRRFRQKEKLKEHIQQCDFFQRQLLIFDNLKKIKPCWLKIKRLENPTQVEECLKKYIRVQKEKERQLRQEKTRNRNTAKSKVFKLNIAASASDCQECQTTVTAQTELVSAAVRVSIGHEKANKATASKFVYCVDRLRAIKEGRRTAALQDMQPQPQPQPQLQQQRPESQPANCRPLQPKVPTVQPSPAGNVPVIVAPAISQSHVSYVLQTQPVHAPPRFIITNRRASVGPSVYQPPRPSPPLDRNQYIQYHNVRPTAPPVTHQFRPPLQMHQQQPIVRQMLSVPQQAMMSNMQHSSAAQQQMQLNLNRQPIIHHGSQHPPQRLQLPPANIPVQHLDSNSSQATLKILTPVELNKRINNQPVASQSRGGGYHQNGNNGKLQRIEH